LATEEESAKAREDGSLANAQVWLCGHCKDVTVAQPADMVNILLHLRMT
jgi:hypothetical protein